MTPEFAASIEGTQRGACIFRSAKTIDGRVVVSSNALNEFPRLFEPLGENVNFVWLSVDDFPKEEIKLN